MRAISVAVALQGLRDSQALTVQRFERVIRMLASSAARCWRDRSRFSSANNHLVGELAGLAVVALLLPDLRPAQRWLHKRCPDSPSRRRDKSCSTVPELNRPRVPDVHCRAAGGRYGPARGGRQGGPACRARCDQPERGTTWRHWSTPTTRLFGTAMTTRALLCGWARAAQNRSGTPGSRRSVHGDERARCRRQETLSSVWIEAARARRWAPHRDLRTTACGKPVRGVRRAGDPAVRRTPADDGRRPVGLPVHRRARTR